MKAEVLPTRKQGTDRPPCSGALPGLAQFSHLFSWYSFVLKRMDAGWEMGTIVLDRDVTHKLSRCIHCYSAVNLNFLSYVRLQTARGFKNSPTLFNEILAKDVRRLHMDQGETDDFPARMEKNIGSDKSASEGHIKKTFTKLCYKTHLKWDKILTIALLYVLVDPRSGLGLSPYEITYRRSCLAPKSKKDKQFYHRSKN